MATARKARQALVEGDEARVLKLIRKPVERRYTQAWGDLKQLIHDAGRLGLAQAAHHLVTLLPTEDQKANILSVWALAVEAGHDAMAHAWQTAHAASFTSWGERYTEAVMQDAWLAANRLLDEHPMLGASRAGWTIQHLQQLPQRAGELLPSTCIRLLRRVKDQAEPNTWWRSAVVAMRGGDADLLGILVPEGETVPSGRHNYAEPLWSEALFQQRLDWMDLLEQRLAYAPNPSVWVHRLDEAVRNDHPDFVREVLLQRPDWLAHLQQPEGRYAWERLTRALLEHIEQQGPQVSASPLWDTLTEGRTPESLRLFVSSSALFIPREQPGALNAMVLLVPPDVGRSWIEADPDLFAPALPFWRDRWAQAEKSTPASRRTRPRA